MILISVSTCLKTIFFYIILKPGPLLLRWICRLKTIFFYIILKHSVYNIQKRVGLKTIFFYIILKHPLKISITGSGLENHILLHHSQTLDTLKNKCYKLENHILLHHSQTHCLT